MVNSYSNLVSRPRIIVVGSSNTDLVLQCDNLPRPGETVLGREFQRFPGGKGANQAVAASCCGARVSFIGACGSDEFGKDAKMGLRKYGVDVRYFVTRPDVSSGVALIMLGGEKRENIIAVARSANDTLSARDVEAAASSFRNCSAVLAQLEIPLEAVEAAAALALKNNVPFILNPAPARALPRELLGKVHTLTPNEHEASSLAGISSLKIASLRKAAKKLCEMGCKNVVVTLGEKGALLVNSDTDLHIPAPRVTPVDTVGAGDAFTAYYSAGIAEGLSVEDSVRRAVKAATICVTRPGAQPSMPARSEVL